MLTTAITAAIFAALAPFGVEPTAFNVAAIWIAVKVIVVMGILGTASKFMQRRKAAATATDPVERP